MLHAAKLAKAGKLGGEAVPIKACEIWNTTLNGPVYAPIRATNLGIPCASDPSPSSPLLLCRRRLVAFLVMHSVLGS